MAEKPVKRVVLAYSGGLDASTIVKWLQTELGAEVATFTADLGQGEDPEDVAGDGKALDHTVTWAPSSTTRPGGILKKSVGLAAFLVRKM